MLCFVCLSENRDAPNNAVTYAQGTSVCREHIAAVGSTDMMSLIYRLREAAEKAKARKQTVTINGSGDLES